jgi:hypothetical protein
VCIRSRHPCRGAKSWLTYKGFNCSQAQLHTAAPRLGVQHATARENQSA